MKEVKRDKIVLIWSDSFTIQKCTRCFVKNNNNKNAFSFKCSVCQSPPIVSQTSLVLNSLLWYNCTYQSTIASRILIIEFIFECFESLTFFSIYWRATCKFKNQAWLCHIRLASVRREDYVVLVVSVTIKWHIFKIK